MKRKKTLTSGEETQEGGFLTGLPARRMGARSRAKLSERQPSGQATTPTKTGNARAGPGVRSQATAQIYKMPLISPRPHLPSV